MLHHQAHPLSGVAGFPARLRSTPLEISQISMRWTPLMNGEFKGRKNPKSTVLETKQKLHQELADELEFVYHRLNDKSWKPLVTSSSVRRQMSIQSRAFNREVKVYVMRFLGRGVYLATEIHTMTLPTYLKDIGQYLAAIKKVLKSRRRFEISANIVQEDANGDDAQSGPPSPLVPIVRDSSHTPWKRSRRVGMSQ
ncbi:hypothetical protein HDU86_000540 [Geranomyces michiganensis]|nr:hypothetical protein HDU86_000540 [Geranomyces michiganensis]